MKSRNQQSKETRNYSIKLNVSLWDQHFVTLIWKNRVFGVLGGFPPASSPANMGQTGFVVVVSTALLT